MLPQRLDSATFYAQRDARAGLEHPLASIPSRRIAIAVPLDMGSRQGAELALYWTASIIRRMGRAFAELVIVSSDEFRKGKAHSKSANGSSIEQFVVNELRSADPFARVEWRTWK